MNKPIKFAKISLSMQMIADELEELQWEYNIFTAGNEANLVGFNIYYGVNDSLRKDYLYLIATGKAGSFPTDDYSYICTENLEGQAPHIRCINRSDTEILATVISIFQRYTDFETELNAIVLNEGSLNQLCQAGCRFFRNPLYIHDRMFTVIALPKYVDGMLKFDKNESTGNVHIPLWLINEFKFDDAYLETMKKQNASIWGNDQYPYNIRSLYVNLYDDDYYYGRLLINEIESALKPGQFKLAEIFAEYIKLIIKRDNERKNIYYRDYEDTITSIIENGSCEKEDSDAFLEIQGWKESDNYICLKFQAQSEDISIKSDAALRSQIAITFKGCYDFFLDQRLTVIINLTKSGETAASVRSKLATVVRDSYMYCGISNPIHRFFDLKLAVKETDITLEYIKANSDTWLMSFEDCAMDYIMENIKGDIPVSDLISPNLFRLHKVDVEKGTEYLKTFRSFIKNERSIPKTSEELIIHRSTLLYRLEKIQDLLKTDLDNEKARIYIEMSFIFADKLKLFE